MTAATRKTTTRKVAGVRLSLIPGVRYVASRPFAKWHHTEYPVTIQPMIGRPVDAVSVTIPGLTYEAANRLVNAFNNGAMSFDGREW